MPTYDEFGNYLVSDSGGAPPASPLVMQAQSGIGLNPGVQAPAPVESRFVPPAPQAAQPGFAEKGGGLEMIGTILSEFGAGFQGRPSPLQARMKAQREDRRVKLEEFKVHTDALEDGVKMAGKLQGDARKQFIENYADQLDEVRPGLGDTFRSVSQQPDVSEWMMKNVKEFPELEMALKFDPTGKSAMDIVKSAEFQKRVVSVMDGKKMTSILTKGRTFMESWQQLVPDQKIDADGDGRVSASEFLLGNETLKTKNPELFKKIGIDDSELQVILRNPDSFWGALGIVSPKTEQAILKERSKEKGGNERDRRIKRLQDTGVPLDIATGIVEGRLKLSRNPISGEVDVTDLGTGQPFTYPGGSADNATAPDTPAERKTSTPADLDVSESTGPSGYIYNLANTIVGVLGQPPSHPDTQKGYEALNNLAVRTETGLQAAIPGRPSNYLMERLKTLTVEPAAFLTYDSKAFAKFNQTKAMLDNEIERIREDILKYPGSYKPGEISAARRNMSELTNLRREYDVVISNFDKKKNQQKQGWSIKKLP